MTSYASNDSKTVALDFFVNSFQKDIWGANYQYLGEDLGVTLTRQIDAIFGEETETIKSAVYDAMATRRLFFGGRVTANVGTGLKNVFPFNCYAAQRSVKPVDSIKCIYSDLEKAAHILKTEGGIGFNFNHLRPRATLIKGVGVGTPGAISFMDLFNESAENITKGNPGDILQVANDSITKKKIRKGAQMGMLDCRHPDVVEFIEAKKVPNRLDRFNLSVIITDEFMRTLEAGGEHILWFPDIHFEKYDEEWDGDFDEWEAKGYPKSEYARMPAQELWDLIIANMYNRNEPGLYFIDNANRYNNLIYYQKVTGTNPCGEISMLADGGIYEDKKTGIIYEHLGDICNLGTLNLVEYWDPTYFKVQSDKRFAFNFDAFADDVRLLVRGLDNLISTAGYPLPELKAAAQLRRKIGAGIMGYGSILMMLGLRYGSEEAMVFTEDLMKLMANVAYDESANLAAEKGPFILYNEDEIFNGGFIKNSGVLNDDVLAKIRKNGLRNSQLLTVAPTGTLSMYAGCVSGGIEPVFEKEYWRWVISNHEAAAVLGDLEFPQWSKGEWHQTKDFKFNMVGDTEVLLSKCGNIMIDQSRGLTKKVQIEDYGWLRAKEIWKDHLEDMEEAGVFDCAQDLSATDHVEPFILLSKYIDNSISKTVNLPNDYPIEDFDALYRKLWREGARGMTTYREGTMIAVLETKKETKNEAKEVKKEQKEFFSVWKEHERGDVIQDDVALPAEYPMQGFKIESEGKKWYFSIAFKDKKCTRPFGIFVTTNHTESNIVAHGAIEALMELAESEGIATELIEDNDKKSAGQNNVNRITRAIGLLLRHNVKIEKIVKTLDTLDIPIFSLVYRLNKFLMRYIDEMENGMVCPNCGEAVVLREGCISCGGSCGWTKC